MDELDQTTGHSFPDEIAINLHMLRAFMKCRIGGKVNSRLAIAEHHRRIKLDFKILQ